LAPATDCISSSQAKLQVNTTGAVATPKWVAATLTYLQFSGTLLGKLWLGRLQRRGVVDHEISQYR